MVAIAGDSSQCYSSKQLKRKLKEHYGDHLIFMDEPGRSNMLCFKNFAWFIMDSFKKSKLPIPSSIITAVSKTIKSELRQMKRAKSYYPNIEQMGDINIISLSLASLYHMTK